MPRDFRFRVQHLAAPGDPSASSPLIPVLDSYLEDHPDVIGVYGVFAFATASGVSVLRESDAWRRFAESDSRQLLVGFDAITNSSAVESLRRAAEDLPAGSVMGIDPAHPAQLAHPKFLLFEDASGEVVVCVSSNNLTRPALEFTGPLVNGEAYCIVTLDDPDECNDCLEQFRSFTENWALHLVDINDPRVDDWAEANDRQHQDVAARSGPRAAKQMAASTGAVSVPGKDHCLVMRTPTERGHTQIGITAAIAREYFGTTHAVVGVEYVPQPAAGNLPQPQGVVREVLGGPRGGGNVGVELRGVGLALTEHGEQFTNNARPLVVLRELAPSYYRYTVLLPEAHADLYDRVDAWLSHPDTNAMNTGGEGTPVLRAIAPTQTAVLLFGPQPFPLD